MHRCHAWPSLPINQIPNLTCTQPGVIQLHDTAAELRYASGPVHSTHPLHTSNFFWKKSKLKVDNNHCSATNGKFELIVYESSGRTCQVVDASTSHPFQQHLWLMNHYSAEM